MRIESPKETWLNPGVEHKYTQFTNKLTLLQMTPSLTDYSDIVSGISSGIYIWQTYSDNLSDVSSGIYCDSV